MLCCGSVRWSRRAGRHGYCNGVGKAVDGWREGADGGSVLGGLFLFCLFKGVDCCSLSVQKTLEMNVQMQNMFLPGGIVGDEGQ